MPEEENFVESIHNERYYERYDPRNITHESMIFMGGRSTETLNGTWHYVEDLYDVGFRDAWERPRGRDAGRMTEPWDFNLGEGEVTNLPGCWNLIEPRLFYFEGTVWYSRVLDYQERQPDERVFLRIGAANYDTKIYVNDEFLGNHVGGSTPFFAELTGLVKGTNWLLIAVNNERRSDRVPMKNTDWYNWGGIYRNIELVRVPPTFIREFSVYLEPDGSLETISMRCVLSEPVSGEGRLEIPALGVDRGVVVRGGTGSVQLRVKPDLWSPESPTLYEVSFSYGEDRVSDLVGLREITTRGTSVFLNGKRIFLKGISVHEDDVVNGKLLTDFDLQRRFEHVKELGANCMRLAHYPHDERVALMADREGILLWEEIPVYWAIAFDNEATYADAENQLAELVKRDRNRASVILWSVGNENVDTDSRLSFMRRLADAARAIDSTRLVTAACLVNHQKLRIEDRLAGHLDVIGVNEYCGWYVQEFEQLERIVANSRPDRPVFISEFGAGAKAGYHGAENELFTEEFMEDVYRRQIGVIRGLEYVCGISPWILYDFTCPRRKNRHQRGFNRKGLIAEDKETRKKAFYTLQEFYQSIG
jgi:beta-glucuronidase